MKHVINIPTFVILGVSIFGFSTTHYDMANVIQSCWTGCWVILLMTCFLYRFCQAKPIKIRIDGVMKTACLIGMLEILYAILQLFDLVPNNYHYAYFAGSLNNPAVFGMLLSFLVPISVYYAIKTTGREKTVWQAMNVIFILFVILSDSRTAVLATFLSIIIIILYEVNSLRAILSNKHFQTFSVFISVIVLICLYFYKKDSADGRLLIWSVCLEMIKDKPLCGWGDDGFIAQYMNYQADYLNTHSDSPFIMLADETQSPFNEFLHIAILYGIPCALLCIGILISTIFYILKKVHEYKSILLSLISILFIWGMFSYPFSVPFVWLIMLFITLLLLRSIDFRYNSMPLLMFVITLGFYSLYVFVTSCSHDLRRVSLQERSIISCDEEVRQDYENMYKEYYDDNLFIYNYGALLHLRGDYRRSIDVFRAGSKYLSDYNMMLLMGDDYQQLGMPDSSVIYYSRANEMIPSRYLPLYYQMRLYLDIDERTNALDMAKKILYKENKTKESKITREVIKEAREILSSKK